VNLLATKMATLLYFALPDFWGE